jgi:hypothetical protein
LSFCDKPKASTQIATTIVIVVSIAMTRLATVNVVAAG